MKNSILAGAGAAVLPGCALMDRFFGLEKLKFENEVIIVGGGAAGLAAAFELKKSEIPFRLFEASPRIGGRIYSLEDFNSDGQVAEMGAEYFESTDQVILSLCKELSLPIDEIKFDRGLDSQVTFSRGRVLTSRETTAKFQRLTTELIRTKVKLLGDRNEIVTRFNAHEFAGAEGFDKLSVADLLRSLESKVEMETLRLFETSCVAQFGNPTSKISAFHLINSIDLEEDSRRTYHKVRFGNQRLLRTMYERVSGVLPNFFVKVDSPLFEVEERNEYFRCHFRTPQGHRIYESRYLILAMPLNRYRTIDGFLKLKISENKKQAVQNAQLASHSKVAMSFKQRFWNKSQEGLAPHRGAFFKEYIPQLTWDSSAGQNGSKGLLSLIVGGELGESVGAAYPDQIVREMQVFGRSFKNEYEGLSHVMNWKRKPHCEGSYVIYGPNEFLKYHGLWGESDYEGRLNYAGEHCHLTRYGSWAGALESGQRAARQIIDLQKRES